MTVPQQAVALERRFSGLVTKIEEGNCVLVLGPRIAAPREVTGGDLPIDDYLAARLVEDLGGAEAGAQTLDLRRAIARYQRDRGSSACRSMVQALAGDLDDHTTALHIDLAALPFPLILSATPDRMMAKALRDHGKSGVREAYYDYRGGVGPDMPLTECRIGSPALVYSLFGRHDHPESMVLDENSLLDYLVNVTRESPALPDVVRAKLRLAETVFLFVGFGFTNWWLRLLLKVLQVTGVEGRVESHALEDDSAFNASTALEHKDFFRLRGIYIQAHDWNALAKDLRSRIRPAPPVVALPASPAGLPAAASVNTTGRPLVFMSYASEDVDRVTALREVLQAHGITVWHDKQNLRAGQYWDQQIARIIDAADYVVFVQSEKMDERDRRLQDGVYNRELSRAINRIPNKPFGTAFLIHATIGTCRPRPEPELEPVHRIAVDTPADGERLAQAILDSYLEATADTRSPAAAAAAG